MITPGTHLTAQPDNGMGNIGIHDPTTLCQQCMVDMAVFDLGAGKKRA
jgi:hypothetical protein